MVLDTGATTSIIPPKVGVAIGCDPSQSTQRISIITASGLEYLPVVRIPLVVCLGHRVRFLPMACHDLPPESTVDGLLGLDFLSSVPAFQEFEKAIRLLTQEYSLPL
jgi:predicted aspartyl protease